MQQRRQNWIQTDTMADALSTQQVLTRQVAILAEDDVFGIVDEHTSAIVIKVPALTAIKDEKESALYKARYRAYALLCKAFKRSDAESISASLQATYIQALRRDLSPFLTNVSATNQPKQNSAPSPGPLLTLALKLYVIIAMILYAKIFSVLLVLILTEVNKH